jgi:hypothetical protein
LEVGKMKKQKLVIAVVMIMSLVLITAYSGKTETSGTEYTTNANEYSMPFAPKDPKKVYNIMTQISEKLANLEELKGNKISMVGSYYIPWFMSQNTAPVSTPAAEVYQDLKTNASQGVLVYDSLAYEYKYFEVMDYMYDVSMGAWC